LARVRLARIMQGIKSARRRAGVEARSDRGDVVTGELAGKIRSVVAREEPRLRALSPESAAAPRAAGKWSRAEVLGHLIDSAANNHQRFVRAQFTQTLIIPGYEQNRWVDAEGYAVEPWGELIGLWAALNIHLAHVAERIPASALSHSITVLGPDGLPGAPIHLEALVVDYLRHLEHHLGQI